MCRKRKRLSDGLSYDLCFKGFGFLIVLIVLIRIVATILNRKPLNPNPKVDQQN
jgi:cytochrome b561